MLLRPFLGPNIGRRQCLTKSRKVDIALRHTPVVSAKACEWCCGNPHALSLSPICEATDRVLPSIALCALADCTEAICSIRSRRCYPALPFCCCCARWSCRKWHGARIWAGMNSWRRLVQSTPTMLSTSTKTMAVLLRTRAQKLAQRPVQYRTRPARQAARKASPTITALRLRWLLACFFRKRRSFRHGTLPIARSWGAACRSMSCRAQIPS